MIKLIFVTLLFSVSAESNYSKNALTAINKLQSNTINYNKYQNHFYSYKQNKKQALIIITGVAEPAIKYWQLLDEFKDSYDLYFWDHVNQGRSPDLIPSIDYKKVHIDNFSTYQLTINNFLNFIKKDYEKINVISHSMGSHIMLRQILKHPKSIDKIALVTPMIDVYKYFIPNWLAQFILKTFYKPTDWAPSQGPKNPDSSYLTTSKENFNNYLSLLHNHFPKLESTGVTAGWLSLSIKSIEQVLNSNLDSITTPMTMFTAGDDIVVKSKVSKQICLKIKNCQLTHYKKAKHQLLIEIDAIRFDVYKKIKVFLNE